MKAAEAVPSTAVDVASLPANFLNAYAVLDSDSLAWSVRTYIVGRADGQPQTHEDRGAIKQAVWSLRNKYKNRCRGYGFAFDVDERTVVVPGGWDLPSGEEVDGYRVTLGDAFTARASEPRHRAIVLGVLREALKKRFKDGFSDDLGVLWRDFDRYCQMPKMNGGRFLFCRRFGASAKALRGGKWVAEVEIGTATLDSRTLAAYYERGEVQELAAMISAKLANRTTRRHGQTAVRVWVPGGSPEAPAAEVLELDDPGVIVAHGLLSREKQKALAANRVRCRRYGGPVFDIGLSEARLVLDTQITQEDHAETIIAPAERVRLMGYVRNFLDGAEAYGCAVRLDRSPVSIEEFETLTVMLPAIRVRGEDGGEMVIAAPVDTTEDALRSRVRERALNVIAAKII